MGKVTIKRNPSGMFAMFGRLPVFLNKEKHEGLKREESKEYSFEGSNAILKVGSGFVGSKEITVQDGQYVEVNTQISSYLIWMTGIIFCVAFRGLIPVLIGVGLLISSFFRPFFKAEVVEK